MTLKLRKQESFFLTWTYDGIRKNGSMALWISPGIPLGFEFSGGDPGPLSREWIDALMSTSYGSRGLVVIPERAVRGRRDP